MYNKLLKRAEVVLGHASPTPLVIEGIVLAELLWEAIGANRASWEISDDADKLRFILDTLELETEQARGRETMGELLKKNPAYREALELLELVPDQSLKTHLHDLVTKGENYG